MPTWFGPQFAGMGQQNAALGQQAIQAGLGGLLDVTGQQNQQAFQALEAQKQRRFQEEQRKKQEAAQKKAMWTNLGINAGTSAAGGAIVGGLAAAEAPIAATAPGVAGGTIPVGDAATTLADTSMGLGMPATVEAAGPALANAPRSLAMSSVPTSGTPGATFASPIAKATYRPFASGSVAGGAAMGGALGALGALGGQNYLGTALAMPGQTYARDVAAVNSDNRNALGWTKLGLDQAQAVAMEAGRNRRFDAGETGKNSRLGQTKYTTTPGGIRASGGNANEIAAFAHDNPMVFPPSRQSSRVNIGVDPETGTLRSLSVPDVNSFSETRDTLKGQGLDFPTVGSAERPKKGPGGRTYYSDDDAFTAYKSLNDIMADPALTDPAASDTRHATIEDWKREHFKYMTPDQQAAITRKLQQRWKYAPRTSGRTNTFGS